MLQFRTGETAQYLHFVAVDATDLKTRETGLSAFTVYRARGGSAAAAMTTPTIAELDATNMPGVYRLLLDEDMTIASGKMSEVMTYHITCSGMAPVTIAIQLIDYPTGDFADKLLGRSIGGAADGGRTVQQALRFLRNKWALSGATLTVYREDDSTSDWTSTVGTNPSAEPIVSNDPA